MRCEVSEERYQCSARAWTHSFGLEHECYSRVIASSSTCSWWFRLQFSHAVTHVTRFYRLLRARSSYSRVRVVCIL